MIDNQTAEKARVKAERRREQLSRARRKYEARNPKRDKNPNRLRYSEYPFVMWDGEAPKDTGYSLFGSSLGDEICSPHLSTEQCFDLLLDSKERNPCTIFVIFGGRYDFDEICRQSIPFDRLSRLKQTGHCTWHSYTIKQQEGKSFTLKKDGVSVTVYEIFGWFHKAYVRALEDYQIGTEVERELLRSEKNRRSEFLWGEIEEIREYMRLELKLGPRLMEKIREIVLSAGFNPRAWYGPSALALEALRKNHIRDYIGTIPSYVSIAAQYAYAGGRFEPFRGGVLEDIHTKDQNSAYMAAALELPDLAHGNWRGGKYFEPGKFAVYHIRYNAPIDPLDRIRLYPLFCRHASGNVNWPNKVEGWYWSPEAELVKDDPYAQFLGAYVFDEASPARPFEFVRDWYRKRLLLESLPESNPSRKAGKAFKWALASVYGQLARTVGWNRFRKAAPKFHCLEWAGYITSRCRAEMFKAAKACGDKLISIDTDSVTAQCPIPGVEGRELGEWKAEHYDRGVFYQSGISALERDGKWIEQHARGIEMRRGRIPVSPEIMMSAIYDGKDIELKSRTRYVSIRMALNHQLDDIGKWRVNPPGSLKFGGGGKRYHQETTCYRNTTAAVHCDSPESHLFSIRPQFMYEDHIWGEIPKSCKHLLPWRDDTSGQLDAKLIGDYLWIDPEQVEQEDREWLDTLIST